jgi:hypothetical protein
MARTYFNKRNEPDVLEVVIQPAVIAGTRKEAFLKS